MSSLGFISSVSLDKESKIEGKWGVYTDDSDVHVIPMEDWIEHKFVDCLCEPEELYIDPETDIPWPAGGKKVTHKAIDGRED